MKIGVMCAGRARIEVIPELEAKARSLEAMGFDSIWIPYVFGFDAIGLAALLGRVTERIEIGTAVVPSQLRHPAVLVQSALTSSALSAGRFTLGIGLSHPPWYATGVSPSPAPVAASVRRVTSASSFLFIFVARGGPEAAACESPPPARKLRGHQFLRPGRASGRPPHRGTTFPRRARAPNQTIRLASFGTK